MSVPSPSRRSTLQTIGGVILGGVAYLRRPRWPGFFGGYIRAWPLEPLIESGRDDDELPPDEYVTPLDDDRLADLAPLREALERYDERVALSRREFGTAFDALEELPEFGGYIYVRDDYTYQIELVPKCSDAWWMESEGTPTGRNRCYGE